MLIKSREYREVPNQLNDDNVVPYMAEIPTMLSNLRHPRRSRSISVGPQSEADAYETLAYREKRRQESKTERLNASTSIRENGKGPQEYFGISTSRTINRRPTDGLKPTPLPSNDELSKALIEAETAVYTPLTERDEGQSSSRASSRERRLIELEEREMFSKLTKPRVRYDVEVVTKLIVYTGKFQHGFGNATWLNLFPGIACIAVDWAPILFEVTGLGLHQYAS